MSEQVPLNEQQVPEAGGEMSWERADTGTTSAPIDPNYVKDTIQQLEDEENMMRDIDDKMSKDASADLAREEVDSRSIYVGNVDYGATPLELQQHFAPAGEVERVTILLNKFTGQPKGFAYVEFKAKESVDTAVETLDGSQFRDRELKVSAKRTNIPGMSSTNRGRGGARGRARGRGFRGRGPRGFRGGRGGPRFNPY